VTDDIIKASKKNNKKAQKPSTPGGASTGTSGSGKKKRKNKKGTAAAGASTPSSAQKNVTAKVIQSVGAGKAKRAAKANQKRGINPTGVATQQAIKKAVTKVAVGTLLKKNNNTPQGKKRNSSKGTPSVGSLKISFKTSDLDKTTEKTTAAQIKAALGKTGRIVTTSGGQGNKGKGKGKGKK
jgi:hypothetical protein